VQRHPKGKADFWMLSQCGGQGFDPPLLHQQNQVSKSGLLVTPESKERIRGMARRAVAQSSINQGDVRSIPLPLPTPSEQEEIAAVLSACDQKIDALEKESSLLDELFKAMLEELMTGRLSALPLIKESAGAETPLARAS
jgi:hypothetical protein